MTKNQLDAMRLQEDKRHNREMESLKTGELIARAAGDTIHVLSGGLGTVAREVTQRAPFQKHVAKRPYHSKGGSNFHKKGEM